MNIHGVNVTMAQIKQAWQELKGYAVPADHSLELAALDLIEVYGMAEFKRAVRVVASREK